MKLVRNMAKCRNCKDIIESKHRHDFVTCSCFNNKGEYTTGLFIDGGLEYSRRGGCFSNLIDMCEYIDTDEDIDE